jgi:meso-butanediol dehydrogenase / (S,S)-butanediol dehydrogenase / diacetyl reductase
MIERPVALITGASGDLGRAIAVSLSQQSIAIVGSGRSAEGLHRMRNALAPGATVETIQQDVRDDNAPADAVALAVERFGRLDYLVNNAGIGRPKPVHETSDEELDLFLNVHLRATFRYCRAALGVFKGDAAIVNIASTFALIGGMRGGAYSAAKAGVVGLTLHMAAQYGSQGVRSNAVAPGVLRTAMTEYAWESERFKRMNFDMAPAPRAGTTEDVAGLVAFLCSPSGAFINGQVIAVDGGWSSTKYLSDAALKRTDSRG